MICIENAKVILEEGILWDGVVLVEGGRIAAVGAAGEVTIPAGARRIDAGGLYVGPGFVDIHVHGDGQRWLYAAPEEAAAHFLRHGETTILAALYYDLTREDFLAAIDRVKTAIERSDAGTIAGFYMEGPYMNPKYGGRPDQNQWKGAITAEDYTAIVDRAGALAKVWAVAPEREGIEPFVQYAKRVNPETVFAVGHSEATPRQVQKLKKYGVRLQTHCMDATGRVPVWTGTRGSGPDEACMLDPEMYAEMICDSLGTHVSAELQRLILRTKGVDRVVLITDCCVRDGQSPEGLRHVPDLCFDPNGLLAGSLLTLDQACRNLMRHTRCGITEAFLMASRNPARAIGLDGEIGTVETGKKADLVFVDDMFHVKNVVLGGVLQQTSETYK